MDRLISFFITLIVAMGLALAYDRQAPAYLTLPIPIWRPKIELPGSLAFQREAVAQVGVEKAATKACQGALSVQGASIRTAAAVSADKLAKATHDLLSARVVAESLRVNIPALQAYQPKGADVCAAWADADKHVVEALK